MSVAVEVPVVFQSCSSRVPVVFQSCSSRVTVVLRSCCGGASQLSIAASSIRDVLDQIERLHPLLYRSVRDDSGAVRRHVNVFVNSSLMQKPAVLETPLASGDIVTIFQAVSGG